MEFVEKSKAMIRLYPAGKLRVIKYAEISERSVRGILEIVCKNMVLELPFVKASPIAAWVLPVWISAWHIGSLTHVWRGPKCHYKRRFLQRER